MSSEGATALLISSDSYGVVTVVRTTGELDYDYAQMFQRELARALDRGSGPPGLLVLDLAGLTFCDSTGMAGLLWGMRRSREAGTRMVLAGASSALLHMLRITGLLPYFETAVSTAEAVERFETAADADPERDPGRPEPEPGSVRIEVDVQPDDRAGPGSGPDLDQVAQLVDQPETPAAQ
ncbi:STAS domain-containing protein [Streptosporangium sp. NPDC048047]|uniref:STAS domain-containing protein n=1 Tax=Streptosporangium sp. NPDC048047 TaxID=3155748 RepID=UPI003440DEA0